MTADKREQILEQVARDGYRKIDGGWVKTYN